MLMTLLTVAYVGAGAALLAGGAPPPRTASVAARAPRVAAVAPEAEAPRCEQTLTPALTLIRNLQRLGR
eukprot:3632905-Prymnesium_polylepis.1